MIKLTITEKGGDARALDECYYSDDHYQSFRRIRP